MHISKNKKGAAQRQNVSFLPATGGTTAPEDDNVVGVKPDGDTEERSAGAELVARIGPFRLHDIVIDPRASKLIRTDGSETHLERRPLQVLLALAAANGKPVSRESLRRAVWHRGLDCDSALTHAISRIRHELGDYASPHRYIETIPRFGYQLTATVEPAATARSSVAENKSPQTASMIRIAWRELMRRRVFQVAVTYGAVSWIVVQTADMAFDYLKFPDWTLSFLALLAILGLPLALVLAWTVQKTEHGLVIEAPISIEPRRSATRLILYTVVTVFLTAASMLAYFWATGDVALGGQSNDLLAPLKSLTPRL